MWAFVCARRWNPAPSGHLPSHASVVQPPTSLWSEEACPVCTSLDQCHMGQTCVVFLGLEREGKRRGQQAAVLAGDSGLVARRTPIGRSSTLAVSDLETSSSGPKPRLFDATLRVYESLVIGLSGRWDPQIVMDCQWAPGLARWVLFDSLAPTA